MITANSFSIINVIQDTAYFGFAISLVAYFFGIAIRRRVNSSLLNPLLVAILIVMAFLYFTGIDFERYYKSSETLPYLLTPATICLAIPLYRQIELLKKYLFAVLAGIFCGVLSNALSLLLMSFFWNLSNRDFATLFPKSVTTAIGMGISDELGGSAAITVAAIIATGLFGNATASKMCSVFKIKEPVAVGLAIGTSSHALGTVRALEIGEVEGAMSGLAVAVAGLMTVVVAPFFVGMVK